MSSLGAGVQAGDLRHGVRQAGRETVVLRCYV